MSLIAEPTYEEFTNLFTNPNLLGDGTWAEVRRNLVTHPCPSMALTGWQIRANDVVDGGATSRGRLLSIVNALTLNQYIALLTTNLTVTAGQVLSGSLIVRNASPNPVTLSLGFWTNTTSVQLSGPDVVIPTGESRELRFDGLVVPTGNTSVSPRLLSKSVPAGSKLDVYDGWTVELAPTARGQLYGAVKPEGLIKPEDFRARWVGTAGITQTVLEGERVRGFLTLMCAAIMSSWMGKPALRIIPTSPTDSFSTARTVISTSARNGGVLLGTANTIGPLAAASLNGDRMGIRINNPQASVKPSINTAGTYPQRLIYSTLSDPYQYTFFNGGLLGGGDVWWTDLANVPGNYTGPAFSGDTEELYYNNVRVFPEWVGEPNNSPSRFRYYTDHQFDVNPRITKWDQVGERRFETGVDRGMLYSSALAGVPWNGLTEIAEKPQGGDPTPYYIDGVKYLNWPVNEDFQATLKAYTYPREFEPHDGMSDGGRGLSIAHQPRKPFGLSYRTKVGNDIDGVDHGYKIHLVYNAIASPSERANLTLSDDPSAIDFSWALTTTPVRLIGKKASAHLVIDSTRTDPYLLRELEEIIYGTAEHPPRLPTGQEILDFFDEWITLLIIDHGDGTFTASGPDDVVYMVDSTMFEIDWASAVYISSDTYTLTSL